MKPENEPPPPSHRQQDASIAMVAIVALVVLLSIFAMKPMINIAQGGSSIQNSTPVQLAPSTSTGQPSRPELHAAP